MPRTALASVLAVAALALAAVRAEAPSVATEPFVPDESGADPREAPAAATGRMVLAGRTWSAAGPGYALHVQRLSDDERGAFIEHTSGERIDPFRTPPGREMRFETFLVQVENRADGPASFNPHDCWLMAGTREVLYPIGLDELGAMYRQLEGEMPAAYERVRPALLDQRTTLEPGESAAGLLVYPAPKRETKRFHVELQLTLPTGDVVRAAAAYRRAR